MVLEESLRVDRQVSVLVKKDLVCFQIQEIVFHFCVGFVLVLSGKPMCIGCLSLGACLPVENYSMKTMESSCSHARNITCQTSAMTHAREVFAFQGKV